jgi:hypothetical protein
MSIVNKNIIPDTLRTFEINSDRFHQVDSIFVTPESFSFSLSDFSDADYWFSQLGINIFPIHSISDYSPQDDPTAYNKSKQNFTYQTNSGKYRHKLKYNFSLDYHKLINELSSEIRIIYASGTTLRALSTDGENVKGFKISAFNLEKMLFGNLQSIGNSEILIELDDPNELNIYGYETQVNWTPQQMDRLVLNISISYGTESMTLYIRYLELPITTISSSDITWTDDLNGSISVSLSNIGHGYYLVNGFSEQPTDGMLSIKSTLYIGQKRYSFVSTVTMENNVLWLNGEDRLWLNGEQRIWLN